MFLFSIAAFGSVSPHFMFGSKLYNRGAILKSEIPLTGGRQASFSIGDESEKMSLAIGNSSLCLTSEAFMNLSNPDQCE